MDKIKEKKEELQPSTEDAILDANSYQVLKSIVKEAKEYYEYMSSKITAALKDRYHLEKDALDAILQFTKDQIENLNGNDMKIFLSGYTEYEYLEELMEKSDEELRKEMEFVKDASITVFSAKAKFDDIMKDNKEIINEYVSYGSSSKERELRKERIQKYKDSLDIIEDPVGKGRALKMIQTMQESIDFSFMTKRLDTLGDKEVQGIMNGFFDISKGSYTVKKFISKIEKFGFNKELYKYFYNLEEKFLDEKYWVYDNLFLFVYMRKVANSDPYDKNDAMLIRSITAAMSNLIYHRFATNQEERDFISIVEKVLDHFEPYRDKFEKENTVHPNHPDRIAKEKEINKEAIADLKVKMERIGMDIDSIDDSIKDDINELTKVYKDYAKKLIDRQLKEAEESEKLSANKNLSLEKFEESAYDANNEVEDTNDAEDTYVPPAELKDISELEKEEISDEEKGMDIKQEDGEAQISETPDEESGESPEEESDADKEAELESDWSRSRWNFDKEDEGSSGNETEDRKAVTEPEKGMEQRESESKNEETQGERSSEGSSSVINNNAERVKQLNQQLKEHEGESKDPMDLNTEPAISIYHKYLLAVSKIREAYSLNKIGKDGADRLLDTAYLDYASEMLNAGYGIRYEKESL